MINIQTWRGQGWALWGCSGIRTKPGCRLGLKETLSKSSRFPLIKWAPSWHPDIFSVPKMFCLGSIFPHSAHFPSSSCSLPAGYLGLSSVSCPSLILPFFSSLLLPLFYSAQLFDGLIHSKALVWLWIQGCCSPGHFHWCVELILCSL